MTPMFGIIASQISGHLASPTSYESIATYTVGSGGQSSITFSSIPSTYKHLQLRYISRNTSAAYYIRMELNSDSGSNYANHYLIGNASSASATSGTAQSYMDIPRSAGAYSSSILNAGVVDLLDYQNTNKYKTMRGLGGYDTNGNGQVVDFISGLWMSTAAINRIYLFSYLGNFAEYSKFALYGIKG